MARDRRLAGWPLPQLNSLCVCVICVCVGGWERAQPIKKKKKAAKEAGDAAPKA